MCGRVTNLSRRKCIQFKVLIFVIGPCGLNPLYNDEHLFEIILTAELVEN